MLTAMKYWYQAVGKMLITSLAYQPVLYVPQMVDAVLQMLHLVTCCFACRHPWVVASRHECEQGRCVQTCADTHIECIQPGLNTMRPRSVLIVGPCYHPDSPTPAAHCDVDEGSIESDHLDGKCKSTNV